MKKIILILLFIRTIAVAQKPDTSKHYFVTIPLTDYQNLVQHMGNSKAWIPYINNMTGDQKTEFQKAIDSYLIGLPNRVKVDSVVSKKQIKTK